MNIDFATKILNRIGDIDPPGCCSSFLAHPDPLQQRNCIELAFVMEHRFAFHYWIKFKQQLIEATSANQLDDATFRPPDLVTWDWHDDTGGECDYDEDELAQLDQRDENEVAMFCWAGLRSLNDGHIAPAIWLNAIGNVYVLQKQHDSDDCESESRQHKNRFGQSREILYFRSPYDFAKTFQNTYEGNGVIWDVDMDFFTEEDSVQDQRYTPVLKTDLIKAIVSSQTPWMPLILRNLRAITIALEPSYTGGLSRSLEIYSAWESALFEAPVFDRDCRWKKDLISTTNKSPSE